MSPTRSLSKNHRGAHGIFKLDVYAQFKVNPTILLFRKQVTKKQKHKIEPEEEEPQQPKAKRGRGRPKKVRTCQDLSIKNTSYVEEKN
jgi:hypothetical protein